MTPGTTTEANRPSKFHTMLCLRPEKHRHSSCNPLPSEIRRCVKAEVDVLSLIVCMVSVDVKQHRMINKFKCRHSELRSCVKVEEVVLGSPSLQVCMVYVGVKQHWMMKVDTQSSWAVWKLRWPSYAPRPNSNTEWWKLTLRAHELCESWGGRHTLHVLIVMYGLCGCKATLNSNLNPFRKILPQN